MVYYANYLKYFERARTHYLEARGLSIAEQLQQGTQFVVVHAELDCRAPSRYGETLTVETRLVEVTRASRTFAHVVRERTSQRAVVEGSAKLAATDLSGKVKRIDQSLIDHLRAE